MQAPCLVPIPCSQRGPDLGSGSANHALALVAFRTEDAAKIGEGSGHSVLRREDDEGVKAGDEEERRREEAVYDGEHHMLLCAW